MTVFLKNSIKKSCEFLLAVCRKNSRDSHELLGKGVRHVLREKALADRAQYLPSRFIVSAKRMRQGGFRIPRTNSSV